MMDDPEYTELELLAHANGILDMAIAKSDDSEMVKIAILAAQYKLDLLKELLE
jgi:hypothetical protein